MIVALIGAFIGWTGTMPNKISFLGVDFESQDNAIGWFLLIVLSFYMVSFFLRAMADYFEFASDAAIAVRQSQEKGEKDVSPAMVKSIFRTLLTGTFKGTPAPALFAFFVTYPDFWFPIVFGLFGLLCLAYRVLYTGFRPFLSG